jgi:hypothetical protein
MDDPSGPIDTKLYTSQIVCQSGNFALSSMGQRSTTFAPKCVGNAKMVKALEWQLLTVAFSGAALVRYRS